MQFDKRLGQGQAQTRALIAALQPVIHLAEGLQRHLHVLRGHADAVVAHRHRDAVRAAFAVSQTCAAPGREFDRIGQEIEENLAQLGGIARAG